MVKWGVRTMTLRAGCRALVCWVSLMGWGGLALAGCHEIYGPAATALALMLALASARSGPIPEPRCRTMVSARNVLYLVQNHDSISIVNHLA